MKRFDFPQYSPEWWAVRRGVPTASCFDQIVTPTKGELSKSSVGYAHQLIADALDPDYGRVSDFATAAMRNGTIMEPEARRYYTFETGVEVEQVGFCLDDDGRFGASPDGLAGADGLLELKSPTPKTHVGYLLAGTLPAEYRPQLHGQLIVTGRAWCDFMSYVVGFPPLLVRVEPDDYTERLRVALDEFADMLDALRARVTALQPVEACA